ncbi:MAG: M3 family metallopeptidase [Sulfurimonas sp.]|nr:M3 family metallopeptidase [Sulfurimonadaceae bacterium]
MDNFLNFNLNLDTFIDELKTLLKQNNQSIDELIKLKSKTYQNFVKELESLETNLSSFFTPLSHINSVNNTPKTQEIYSQALPLLSEYETKISQNIELYNAFKDIQKQKGLSDAQKRVLELNILNFELSGAHLDDATKQKLESINLRKTTLTNDFSQNLLDATNEYELVVDEADVDGLSKSDLAAARFSEDGVTKYKFTLQQPSFVAYMTYGKNRKIREELYRAYVTRAPQNSLIIDELLALRDEMSKLLGYKNYSSFSLATKMAKDEKSVIDFLEKLLKDSQNQAKKELDELQKLSEVKLESYDSAFYSELLKKKMYDIDEEEYRVYFEQDSVLKGTLGFLEKLFGIEFKSVDEPLWDAKAFSYDVLVDGKKSARLYFDLEARKGKRGGAWMNDFSSHHIDKDGKTHLASAVVVCNFAPSSKDNPSLLRHDDVVTLFHELGHALHHVLSEVSESEVSGVNGVEWDAVEFPSQFLENFAYEADVLKLFAKHYKTGETLNGEMIARLNRAKNFLSALGMLRQLEFSLFDFLLHSKLHSGDEVQGLLDSLREKTALIKPPSYNKFQNGFAHIFAGGYAAGYYSYKWAEVLSADAFFGVLDEGVFNSNLAKRYHNIVLKGGGSKSMGELFKTLMGREVEPKNLLRLNGISA